jgi:hypothetical protein
LNEIVSPIERVTALTLTEVITFAHKRISSLARLRELAEARHYSTFDFYSNREFRCALAQFEQNLRERFEDLDDIRWVDENVLLVIKKHEICT